MILNEFFDSNKKHSPQQGVAEGDLQEIQRTKGDEEGLSTKGQNWGKKTLSKIKMLPGSQRFGYTAGAAGSDASFVNADTIIELFDVKHPQDGLRKAGFLSLRSAPWFPIKNSYQVSNVGLDDEYRGTGLGQSLYGIAMKLLKMTIVADDSQTPQARSTWVRLSQIPGVSINGYTSIFRDDWAQGNNPDEIYDDSVLRLIRALSKANGQVLGQNSDFVWVSFPVGANADKGELQSVQKGIAIYSSRHPEEGGTTNGLYARWGGQVREQGVAEAGPFTYSKAPRKGSVADLAAKKRQEQERGKQPIEPKDQQVGVAKVTKGVAEGMEGQVVFSGSGADGGKYEIIQTGPTDFMIHANGKHIDTYSSLQRAMSVLKNEVPGLKKGVAEGPTDDPRFQKMMGNIQQSTPNPVGGYVAVSYASERPSKKIKGVTYNGKPMPSTVDPEGFASSKIKFTPDQIETKLAGIGQKYGWDSIDPGHGPGYDELYFDTSTKYTSATQRKLATNIVKTVNEINKFFNDINRSLQATGLPGYKVNVWQGMGENGNINQYEDLSHITNIAKGQTAKPDAGPAIGKMILKHLPSYEAEKDELGYDSQDFQDARNIANIYITKGERAGLQAQHDYDEVSDMIDELLSDAGASGLRTIWDLDEQGVAEGSFGQNVMQYPRGSVVADKHGNRYTVLGHQGRTLVVKGVVDGKRVMLFPHQLQQGVAEGLNEFDAQGFQQRYTLYKDGYEIEKFGDMDDAIEYAEDDRRDGDDPLAVYKIVDINKQVVWDSDPYEKPSRIQLRKPEQGVAEVSDTTKQSYKAKAQAQVKELEPHAKKGEYRDIAQRAIDRRTKGLARVKDKTNITSVTESGMKEKSIEFRDYQTMTPGAFHSRYSMTRDEWMARNRNLFSKINPAHQARDTALAKMRQAAAARADVKAAQALASRVSEAVTTPEGRPALGQANIETLIQTYKQNRPFAELSFGKSGNLNINRQQMRLIMDHYLKLGSPEEKHDFVYETMSRMLKVVAMFNSYGIDVRTQISMPPGQTSQIPGAQPQLFELDASEVKDTRLSRALKQARAEFPTAGSDIEAFLKLVMSNDDRDLATMNRIQTVNTKQSELIDRIQNIDNQQTKEIDDLESQLDRVTSVNQELERQLDAIQAKPKRDDKKDSKPEQSKQPENKPLRRPATPELPVAQAAKASKPKTKKTQQAKPLELPAPAVKAAPLQIGYDPAQASLFGLDKEVSDVIPIYRGQDSANDSAQSPISMYDKEIGSLTQADLDQDAANDTAQPRRQANAESRKPQRAIADTDFDSPEWHEKVRGIGQRAKQGPLKTVWDEKRKVYRNVPVDRPPANNKPNMTEARLQRRAVLLKILES